MAPYGNLSLGEIVDAAERRAASGEKTHPGFDFASLAPSPLKQQRSAELAEIAQPAPDAASPGSGDERPAKIEDNLDNAWSRLKRQINP